MPKRKTYRSLQHWMEATNTSQTILRTLVQQRAGIYISKSAMSAILTGAHRCSLLKGIALSRVTGVPVEKLVEWPTARSRRILGPPKSEQVVTSGQ
jgi:hypothetical protein